MKRGEKDGNAHRKMEGGNGARMTHRFITGALKWKRGCFYKRPCACPLTDERLFFFCLRQTQITAPFFLVHTPPPIFPDTLHLKAAI